MVYDEGLRAKLAKVEALFRRAGSPGERAAAEAERTDEMTLLADEEGAVFTARIDPRRAPRVGEPLELAVDSERVHFFDPDTGDAIRAT